MLNKTEIDDIIQALRARGEPENPALVPSKTLNIMVMGVVAAAGALVWTTVTDTPGNMGVLQSQTAEIRTTVLELKTTLGGINSRLDNNTRATADQQARLTGIESTVKSNSDRIDRVEQEIRGYDRRSSRAD